MIEFLKYRTLHFFQVDWNFEWMNEKIPVDSPVIPPDSRCVLSDLPD